MKLTWGKPEKKILNFRRSSTLRCQCKGVVCVFECLSGSLALQEFLKAFYFCFTWAIKYQHTKNLHSSAQLFAVTSATSHIFLPLAISWVLAREMADGFVVFYCLHGKFVDCIIRLLFCIKFFAYCRLLNTFIHNVSLFAILETVIYCVL